MASNRQRPLRPVRLAIPRRDREQHDVLSEVPDRVPQRSLAPDWSSPTEGNGLDTPRDVLHIALLARNEADAERLKTITIIKPPLWKGGEIKVHVIVSKDMTRDDILIRQTLVDMGWADSRDLDIGPPAERTLGYPSGASE